MGEGHHGLLHGLSWIMLGVGLATWLGGIALGWRALASPVVPIGHSSEPGPSRAWEAIPSPLAPAETPRPALITPSPPLPTAAPDAGPPLRLWIPAIQLDAPVVPAGLTTVREGQQEWITWEPPHDFAAGWLVTSAYPGQPGNVVLIGHHNIYGRVFANLYRLHPGDRIHLETRRRTHVYRVEAVHILPEKGQPMEVRQRNLQWVLSTRDERLTLVTCWPPHTNTHRLIVVARPSEP
ncbi:sortase [Thermoflexus sp.]|uniref:sortase n=1 Tax=Thermoflexus sp. TaxID=1969742 RepID=UPI002ADD90A2|nr:sortase [Thermoflexus sp.]